MDNFFNIENNIESGINLSNKDKQRLFSSLNTFKKMNLFFTRSENFRSKRFYKYINKVKDKILSFLSEQGIEYKEFNLTFIAEIIKFIFPNIINEIFFETESDEDENGYSAKYISLFPLENIINNYNIKSLFSSSDEQLNEFKTDNIKDFIINLSCDENENIEEFYKMIDYELAESCVRFIEAKILAGEDITIDNYTTRLPEDMEIIGIFFDICNAVYIDLNRWFLNKYITTILENKTKEATQSFMDEFNDLKMDNKTLLEENEVIRQNLILYENKIKMLKKSQDAENIKNTYKKKLHEQQKSYEENIRIIKKKLKRVEEENEHLKRHNIVLNEQIDEIRSSEDDYKKITEDDISGIDLYKRYCFIMDDWASVHNKIKETFPNSVIYGSPTNLFAENIDLVIIMPFHASHEVYYSTKRQCAGKNIPFVHCNSTNIDVIKKVIADNQNNIK